MLLRLTSLECIAGSKAVAVPSSVPWPLVSARGVLRENSSSEGRKVASKVVLI